MSYSKIALAFPLALGLACSTTSGESSDHTGAMWPDSQHKDAATQAYTQGTGSSGSQDPSANTPGGGSSSSDSSSTGSGSMSGSSGSSASGPSDSSGSSGSSDSMGSSGSGSTGGAMGSGGSSETMGSGNPSGGADQGSAGSSDTAQQGASAGAGNTGAHAGAEHVMGKISKISEDEISIKPRSGEAKTLKIKPETSVTINGKDAKPTQLKQGQMVHASYENVSGDDVAVNIRVGKMMRHGRMKHHGGASSGSSGSSESGASGAGGAESGSH